MDTKKLLHPSSAIVLVIDKQAGYFDPAFVEKRGQELPENHDEVLESIDNFIEQARAAGVEVVWTKMVEDANLSPMPISEKMKSDVDGVVSITKPGEPSFEIAGRVKPDGAEKIITKYRYSAFSQTDLAEFLKNKGVTTVVFCGGYASRCVLSSIAGANGEDFFCVIARDLVINQVSASSEVKTLYDIVNAIFGTTMTVDEITSAWNKTSD